MYEIGDYVYIFFREVAIEYINCGKASNLFSARQHNYVERAICYRSSSVRLCPSVCHTAGSVKDGWSEDYATFTTE